jgi:hypothetical protein
VTAARQALEQATAAADRGDSWGCLAQLRQAFEAGETLGAGWQAAVALAQRIGDDTGAVLASERLWRECGGDLEVAFVRAEALTEAGRADEAVPLLAPFAAAGRLGDERDFRYTRMLMVAGRIEEAQTRARALLARHAGNPVLWERIAQGRHFAAGDPDIDAMRRLFARLPADRPAGRAALAAALAKAFVDLGDDAAAGHWLQQKSAANQQRFPFDPAALQDATEDIVRWCESGERDAPAVVAPDTQRPVFILGPARSGTSLLDQILSRHAAIAGGGELRHLWLAARECGDCGTRDLQSFAGRARVAGAADPWSLIGRRYLALADERFGAGRRFSDKLLSNVYRVRLIRRALPAARLLFLLRDPLDVAWSCWRAQFDADSAWSATAAGTALYVACYQRALRAWAARYPEAVTVLEYERLVSEPEAEIPRILAACGLADDPATRRPEESTRAVATVSFAQVRRPIGTRSVGAAAAFPLATRELRAALEALGIETSGTHREHGEANDRSDH